MPKVIHLLPYDGIGGAEEAARSMSQGPVPGFEFQLRFIFPGVRSRSERLATFNPLAIFAAARRLVADAPDLLMVSLWRACLVGILVKLLAPRVRLVVMIHNSLDAHPGDWLATRCAMRLATAIWSDSEASMRRRFRHQPRAPVTVLPFLTRRLTPNPAAVPDTAASQSFIFWGRLAAQKNLRRALKLFARVRREIPEARFTIVGPDSGELALLRKRCEELSLDDEAVTFAGPLDFDAIRTLAAGHAFYLQTSHYEGMAMSVVEAMQLGLVPVVTPVGQVGSYCRDRHNSVIVDVDEEAARRVVELIRQPEAYAALRQNAIATWTDHPLYRDAVAAHCARLLSAGE